MNQANQHPAPPGHALLDLNPRIVVVVTTPFGLWGPYRTFRGTDPVYAALGGVLSQSGFGDGNPVVPPRGIIENSAAVQAAWATVVGLAHAERFGEGQLIDLSIFEAATQVVDPPFGVIGSARAAMDPSLSEQTGRGRPNMPYLYPNLRCRDGWVRIAILGTRQWRGLWTCVGSPPELGGEYFDKMENRFRSWDLIRTFLEDFFSAFTMQELIELGEKYQFPVGEILDRPRASRSAHFAERGVFTSVELPSGRQVPVAAGFVEINGSRWRPNVVAAPGRDNRLLATAGSQGGDARTRHTDRATLSGLMASRCRPLEGLRILDLGVIVVGAETGRLFADLGADVVKVESLQYPDGLRMGHLGPTVTPTFAWGHRNKRSLGLDLRTAGGHRLFERLVEKADAVLSNFKAGTLRSLGLSYDVLSEINPRIVVGESSAYGATGPWARRLGYGPLVRASVGLADVWRDPDKPEVFGDGVTVFPDHANGRVMATAILAGIMHARRTGAGCHVTCAQAETIVNILGSEYLRDSLASPQDQAAKSRACSDLSGIYRCQGDDEWCIVDIQDEPQLQAVLGLLEETSECDAANSTGSAPPLPAEELIAAWALSHTKHEIMWACQSLGVPAGAMMRPMEMLDDCHLRSRGHFTTLRQPGLSDLPTERGPALFSTIAQPELRPAPAFGEHTREVLEDWLQLSAAQFEELTRTGAVQLSGPDPTEAHG